MHTPNLQPHLADDLVTLVPLVAEDWTALYAVASDRLIWADHPVSDRWREPVFHRFFADALESGGALTVRDAQSGSVCGSSRFDVRRAGLGEVEIGWTFLARDHWGGRTNASLKRLMVSHALRDFERVLFLVGETNGRSRRALAKIGAVLTDRVHGAQSGDVRVRHLVFAVDRRQFAEGPLCALPSTVALRPGAATPGRATPVCPSPVLHSFDAPPLFPAPRRARTCRR